MKSFFTLALFVLASAFAIAQPKIEIIGGDTYDWGKVKPKDSPLKATLKIKNAGNQVLNVKEVKAGCGCTTTKIDKDVLQPNEIGSVDVTLNVSNVSGVVIKSITVFSDDPKEGSKVVTIKAEVVRSISTSSPYFAFADNVVGQKLTSKVMVKNNTTESVFLDNFEATNGLILNLKKKTEIKPGAEVELEASYIPTADGYFNSVVKFTTTNPDFPNMELSAYGNVKKPDSPVYQK
jgi:hypothetical protein